MEKETFRLERLRQYRVTDGKLDECLQDLLEMWWSSQGRRGISPIITGITIHYREKPRKRRRYKGGG